MTLTEFKTRLDYYIDLLGIKQVKIDNGKKWGLIVNMNGLLNMKKAFIYINTLSRYQPESSNSIGEADVESIFTQLEKLLI